MKTQTIEQKLYKVRELLREVGACLDFNDPLSFKIMSAQSMICLIGKSMPRNMLSYVPKKDRHE